MYPSTDVETDTDAEERDYGILLPPIPAPADEGSQRTFPEDTGIWFPPPRAPYKWPPGRTPIPDKMDRPPRSGVGPWNAQLPRIPVPRVPRVIPRGPRTSPQPRPWRPPRLPKPDELPFPFGPGGLPLPEQEPGQGVPFPPSTKPQMPNPDDYPQRPFDPLQPRIPKPEPQRRGAPLPRYPDPIKLPVPEYPEAQPQPIFRPEIPQIQPEPPPSVPIPRAPSAPNVPRTSPIQKPAPQRRRFPWPLTWPFIVPRPSPSPFIQPQPFVQPQPQPQPEPLPVPEPAAPPRPQPQPEPERLTEPQPGLLPLPQAQPQPQPDDCECPPRNPRQLSDKVASVTPYRRRMSVYSLANLWKGKPK